MQVQSGQRWSCQLRVKLGKPEFSQHLFTNTGRASASSRRIVNPHESRIGDDLPLRCKCFFCNNVLRNVFPCDQPSRPVNLPQSSTAVNALGIRDRRWHLVGPCLIENETQERHSAAGEARCSNENKSPPTWAVSLPSSATCVNGQLTVLNRVRFDGDRCHPDDDARRQVPCQQPKSN